MWFEAYDLAAMGEAKLKKSDLIKDLTVNLSGVSMLFSIYCTVAKLLGADKSTEMMEEAAKISMIVLIGSTTASFYRNAIKNKEDKHFRMHLLGTILTNTAVAGALYFTKTFIPPQAGLEETNKTLFSTPYFTNILANYVGDGTATIINNHFDIRDFKKRTMLFGCSVLPVLLCNLLFYLKFDKDSDTAISESAAIVAFNLIVNIFHYLSGKNKNKEESLLFAKDKKGRTQIVIMPADASPVMLPNN